MNILKKISIFIILIILNKINIVSSIELVKNKTTNINLTGKIQISNKTSDFSKNNLNNSKIFINVDFNKKYNKILTFARWEQSLNINDHEETDPIKKNKLRNKDYTTIIYMGLKNKKIGNISYGKNYTVIYDVLKLTNLAPTNKSLFIYPNSMTNSGDNILTYYKKVKLKKNNYFEKIKIKIQLYGKNKNGNSLHEMSTTTGYGCGILYTYYTPYNFQVLTSLANQNHYIHQRIKPQYMIHGHLKPHKMAFSAGIKYNFKDLYIACTYTKAYHTIPVHLTIYKPYDNNYIVKYGFIPNINNTSLIIKYKLNPNLTSVIKYVQTTATNIDQVKVNKNTYTEFNTDIERYFDIGAIAKINQSIHAYINYKIDKVKFSKYIKYIDSKKSPINKLSIGLTFNF